MTGVTLVFPAGLPDAVGFRAEAVAQGRRLIGASSLRFDAVSALYDHWARLPYVHESDFEQALSDLIEANNITAIYAPHEVVSGVVAELLARRFPQVSLIAAAPLSAREREYRDLHARAAVLESRPDWLVPEAGIRPRISGSALSGLLRIVGQIPGMTDDDKIAAIIEIFRYIPVGDIVEIGSWWGRSAALMSLLSGYYNLGNVLCADPWCADNLVQGVEVLDQASAVMDTDEAFHIFQTNLALLARGRLGYIRAESAAAAALYRSGLRLTSDTFGETVYDGRIALLHIDGNHSVDNALRDTQLWTPHMKPGGVVIFDDYVWAFGDGPKRAGDAFLEAQAAHIAQSFVIGTALFVQLGTDHER